MNDGFLNDSSTFARTKAYDTKKIAFQEILLSLPILTTIVELIDHRNCCTYRPRSKRGLQVVPVSNKVF